MTILRYCFDRRVLAVLALVAFAVALLAPRALIAALPLLLLAACPLSMVVMAVVINRSSAPPAPPASVDSIRPELGELAERKHRLESELAAAEAEGAR
jgi:hypothetical protein